MTTNPSLSINVVCIHLPIAAHSSQSPVFLIGLIVVFSSERVNLLGRSRENMLGLIKAVSGRKPKLKRLANQITSLYTTPQYANRLDKIEKTFNGTLVH